MRIDNMIQSLRVLAKADAMIAEAAFKARVWQFALCGIALAIAVFGLGMIGMAIFLALQDVWGTMWAAVAVGLGSFVLAGLIVALSSYRRPARDLQLAQDMHKMALDSLVEEARLAGSDIASIQGLVRSAAKGTLIGTIAPVVRLLLRWLSRSGAATQRTET